MARRSNVMQRSPRIPQQPRNRKRWAAVAAVAVLWVILSYGSGSVIAGTVLLVLLALAVVMIMVALRSLGINRDHPWMQWLAGGPRSDDIERAAPVPWRDVSEPAGWRDVSNPAGPVPWRDVSEPGGPAQRRGASAPASPAPWQGASGPADRAQWRDDGASPAQWGDDSNQAGQGVGWPRLNDRSAQAGGDDRRPSSPPGPAQPADSVLAHARDGGSYLDPAAARTVVSEFVTVAAQAPVPPLRLLTNGQVNETRISGARAGRGREAELWLPEEPTVSRVHAEFTFTDGRWHVTNLGLNGITLNGTPLTAVHELRDGDSIGWGTQPGALTSRVEIGRDRAGQRNGPR